MGRFLQRQPPWALTPTNRETSAGVSALMFALMFEISWLGASKRLNFSLCAQRKKPDQNVILLLSKLPNGSIARLFQHRVDDGLLQPLR